MSGLCFAVLHWVSVPQYALALVLLLLPVSQACYAGALPPSRSDIGTTVFTDGQAQTGTRFSTGGHSASFSGQDEDYDFGVGYVYERVEAAAGDITTRHVVTEEGATDANQGVRISQGAYLSFERVLHRDRRHRQRTWLGMRGEYLRASDEDGGDSLSLLARLNWEVFTKVEAAGSTETNCGAAFGMAYGTLGIGFYGEAGARRSMDGVASFVATMGLSLRLPVLAGFGYDLCPD